MYCSHKLPRNQAQDPVRLEDIRGYPSVQALKTLGIHTRLPLAFERVQSEPGEVLTMVASELVGPNNKVAPRLPTEEAEAVPRHVCIRRNLGCGSTASRRGCIAADARPRRVNERERRLETPASEPAVLRTSRSVRRSVARTTQDAGWAAGGAVPPARSAESTVF